MRKGVILLLALLLIAAAVFFAEHKREEYPYMTNEEIKSDEIMQVWGNFVERDVKPHGTLDKRTRYLVLLAGNAAAQGFGSYEMLLREALKAGVKPEEIKESLYQAVPYAGMAKIYDFLILTDKIFAQSGIKLPLAKAGVVNEDTRFEQGLKAQKDIFGSEHIDVMRQNAPADLKHIQDYLSANCFGDYYSRGILDIKTRELLTFVVLVSMGGADPQAKAHAGGNKNIGNSRALLIDSVTQLLPYIGYPRALNAISAIQSAYGA